jgi:hypothetical protein
MILEDQTHPSDADSERFPVGEPLRGFNLGIAPGSSYILLMVDRG